MLKYTFVFVSCLCFSCESTDNNLNPKEIASIKEKDILKKEQIVFLDFDGKTRLDSMEIAFSYTNSNKNLERPISMAMVFPIKDTFRHKN
jgi:hypothetical protein